MKTKPCSLNIPVPAFLKPLKRLVESVDILLADTYTGIAHDYLKLPLYMIKGNAYTDTSVIGIFDSIIYDI